MENYIKRFTKIAIFLIVVLLGMGIWFYSSVILIGAADYLAPQGNSRADVIVIEGNELLKEKAVKYGLEKMVFDGVKAGRSGDSATKGK